MTHRTAELIFGSTLLCIGIALFVHTYEESYSLMAQELSLGPMFFPRVLLILWTGCCVAVLVGALNTDRPLEAFMWGRVLCAFGIVALFVLLFATMGYVAAGLVYFTGMSWFLGYRRVGVLGGVALVYTVFMQFLFTDILGFVLPAFPGWGG